MFGNDNKQPELIVASTLHFETQLRSCWWKKTLKNGNGNGIYIPHFLYVYNQMRFTFNHPTHES